MKDSLLKITGARPKTRTKPTRPGVWMRRLRWGIFALVLAAPAASAVQAGAVSGTARVSLHIAADCMVVSGEGRGPGAPEVRCSFGVPHARTVRKETVVIPGEAGRATVQVTTLTF